MEGEIYIYTHTYIYIKNIKIYTYFKIYIYTHIYNLIAPKGKIVMDLAFSFLLKSTIMRFKMPTYQRRNI